MGHTNSTANLALPQFIGTDKPTWLSDVNGAFAAIDTYAGNNDAALAITDAKADTAINDAASAVTTATNAANTAGTASTQATNAVTVAGNALTVANGINSKVGVLTDLHTTDKSTVVAAINEVFDAQAAPTAAEVSYDNTGSGLTATNVQAAIDEVAQGGGSSYTKISFPVTAVAVNIANGSVYVNDSANTTIDISSYGFVTPPTVLSVTYTTSDGNDAWIYIKEVTATSVRVQLVRGTSAASTSGTINMLLA